MNASVIRGEGLGKKYRRGMVSSNGLLRDSLGRMLKSPLRSMQGQKQETFWALKDVSLEVKEGEVLGLIGRNGAGKTTLLKILSRITQPTTGWAEIHGRVGSLLEVGTGFHPELTGRENTFLSGAILGMSKREISAKFDEIVAFAELEKFIDTPVKHYSSGMYVRLAFAVAAHLEPEILLVDEVLAVGDINFQKKCLGKMGDVARAGRTVVLVTHQMNQIRRLCHRVLWIDDGSIRRNGNTSEVVNAYESSMAGSERSESAIRPEGVRARFLSWRLDVSESEPHTLTTFGHVTFNLDLQVTENLRNAEYGIALFNSERQLLWAQAQQGISLISGRHTFSHSFPMLPLKPGAYQWQVSLWDGGEMLDMWDCSPDMTVATEGQQHYLDEWNGILNLPSNFSSINREDQV
ncbi:MAG TPA: polysaccharide ABC transporter ATP-binding protein [Candidatus Dormibacteraeota bacterium]|nr:polysaccharide ABC transporter ATP-binding protein [Candidatus Dormibacteraeota bacterium]